MEESGLKLECPCGNVGELELEKYRYLTVSIFSIFSKHHIDNIDVFWENRWSISLTVELFKFGQHFIRCSIQNLFSEFQQFNNLDAFDFLIIKYK